MVECFNRREDSKVESNPGCVGGVTVLYEPSAKTLRYSIADKNLICILYP